MTPDQLVAQNRSMVRAALDSGDTRWVGLMKHARWMAPQLLKDIDPRTPPEAVGQALFIAASDALALAIAADDGAPMSYGTQVQANAIAMIAEALIELGEQV